MNTMKLTLNKNYLRRFTSKNVVVRCGLKVGLSDDSATRGLIPMHVQEAEWKNKASQWRLVFPPKVFWISRTNILAPVLFYF